LASFIGLVAHIRKLVKIILRGLLGFIESGVCSFVLVAFEQFRSGVDLRHLDIAVAGLAVVLEGRPVLATGALTAQRVQVLAADLLSGAAVLLARAHLSNA